MGAVPSRDMFAGAWLDAKVGFWDLPGLWPGKCSGDCIELFLPGYCRLVFEEHDVFIRPVDLLVGDRHFIILKCLRKCLSKC